ncbi:MAG: membrane fusion protein (multidrug efflux system) [Flavobacterium sp.]|jgi:membrane fusion protein (multidrug efflux system)
MKIKYVLYTLLFVGFGAFITYRIVENRADSNTAMANSEKPKAMRLSGIVVQLQTFDNNLSLSGSIEANEQVEIRSEISGIVESINFQEGSNVSKGQLLFKVNDTELRAQLSQSNTKESLASENERRAKLLLQKEAISQEEYDVARAEHASTKAQSQLIQAQIAKTAVRAPFSGRIGLRSISVGTYITATVLVANLVNIGKLKITFSIPEKYVNELNPNSTILFTVTGSNKKYTAKIYAIEPIIEIATRTLQVRAITDNKDGKLLPGTFANVELPLDVIKDAIVVPTQAVIPVQNGKKVFISDMGKAKQVMVETATRTDASLLIISGLKAGDTVITTGVMSLKNDAPVKIIVQK